MKKTLVIAAVLSALSAASFAQAPEAAPAPAAAASTTHKVKHAVVKHHKAAHKAKAAKHQ